MAAKEIDRTRANSALAVVRQHPGMTLFAVSPVLLAFGVVWWLTSFGLALLMLLVVAGIGGVMLLLRR